jgi:hypothetical protein
MEDTMTLKEQISEKWSVERLQGASTSMVYGDPDTGDWTPQRRGLHEEIIDRLLAGRLAKEAPEILVVMGGVGSENQL